MPKKFLNKLENLKTKLKNRDERLQEATLISYNYLRRNAPSDSTRPDGYRTSDDIWGKRLVNSFKIVLDKEGSHLIFDHPSNNADTKGNLLEWLTYGTKSHIIRSDNLLSFWWVKNSEQFLGKSVEHPGAKSNDFLERSFLQSANDRYNEVIGGTIRDIRGVLK